MKYKAKDIKKLGRAYGKRAFKLNENDYTDLAQIEQAYLAGFKKGREYERTECYEEIRKARNGIALANALRYIDRYNNF